MKHIILAIVFALSSAAMAAEAKKSSKSFERQYGLAGCGLGSVVMGKHGGQVSAATTNGTLWNQTFAISAGTLNCVDSNSSEVASRMDQFIIVNRSQVQGDIAKGNGETISALSSYMGCSQSSDEIGKSLKANYSEIFKANLPANEVTDGIINVILSNPELSSKCNKLVG